MLPPSPAPDCLTALIGLSDGALPCFALPTDATEAAAAVSSATGLYLADGDGLKLGPAPGAGPASDLYPQLAKARKLAAFHLRTALEAARGKSSGLPLFQGRGSLGGLGNGQLMPAGTRALLSFYTNERRAGAWRVVDLSLYTDVAVTAAPLLLDGVQVGLLTTTGPTGTTSGLPAGGVVIPLDGNQHTLEVLLPVGVRVRANNFFAGCFSCQAGSPWFSSVIGTRQPNGTYLGGSLGNITATTPGNGFAITVKQECTVDADLLCYVVQPDADETQARYPELARYLGIALLYKAAELFTDSLLASNAVNRYTMLEPKMLLALSEGYAAKYQQYLAWLNSPEGMGQVQHPCFFRAQPQGIGKEWTL